MSEFRLALGDRVKDRLTGLTGIIVARTEWLNYCNRYTVQPQKIKDGKPVESTVFDEGDLTLLMAAVFNGEQKKVRRNMYTGGPPTRGADPRR